MVSTVTPSLARSRTQLALLPLAVSTGAVAVGFGLSYALFAHDLATRHGLDALGAAVLFVAIGALVSLAGYVVGSIVGVAVVQPAGRRLGPGAVLLGAPLPLVLALQAATSGRNSAFGSVGALVLVLGTVAGVVMLLWVSAKLAPATWLATPGAAIATGLALLAVSNAVY